VSAPSLSPDKKKMLFGISYESVEENRSNLDLYVKNLDDSTTTRITSTAKSEGGAVWIENGERIAFLYPDANGKPQVWVMAADGSTRMQVSDVENGVGGFLFSPDGKKVVLISNVKYARTAQDIYPDLPKATWWMTLCISTGMNG
jgi:Tol biopolymer transport system component